jgi:hypothetical protein
MIKYVYALLAIIGFLLPNYFLLHILQDQGGFNLQNFLQEISLNNSMKLVNADLSVTALTGLMLMVIEGRRLHVKYWWFGIIGTILVGMSFGLPLFLLLREMRLESLKIENS